MRQWAVHSRESSLYSRNCQTLSVPRYSRGANITGSAGSYTSGGRLFSPCRGQITLPAGFRKRLGIKPGGVVILEDRDGELVVKPAAVVAVENYSDRQIAEWAADDVLTDGQRNAIRRRLSQRS